MSKLQYLKVFQAIAKINHQIFKISTKYIVTKCRKLFYLLKMNFKIIQTFTGNT